MHVQHMSQRSCSQKKVSDALELKLQAIVSYPVWCWELNLGPLKVQKDLTDEPALQSLLEILRFKVNTQ